MTANPIDTFNQSARGALEPALQLAYVDGYNAGNFGRASAAGEVLEWDNTMPALTAAAKEYAEEMVKRALQHE